MMRSTAWLLMLAGVCLAADPVRLPPGIFLEDQPKDANAAKIVLIAGSSYYKPGEHEYLANCAALAKLLAQTPGVEPVFAVDWPKKPETWQNAKAIVFFFDGGDKHAVLKESRAAEITKLLDAGVGLVQFHQSADYPATFGDRARDWAGGCWQKGKSSRAHWVAEFKDFPKHPICHGVEPFKIDDGWLYKLQFVAGMKGITPLLRTDDPKAKSPPKPEESTVSWAYERMNGRSFTFTGGHLHSNFGQPGYRRFLINGILWSAGLAVPDNGARADINERELNVLLATPPKTK